MGLCKQSLVCIVPLKIPKKKKKRKNVSHLSSDNIKLTVDMVLFLINELVVLKLHSCCSLHFLFSHV